MAVGDDRQNKPTSAKDEGEPVSVPRPAATIAKGSDRLARERIRPAPTVKVDAEAISDLIELAGDDKRTRKMDADQFRSLVAETRATEPAPRTIHTTAELMASVDEAFVDLGPDVEAPPPAEKPKAVIVEDHRLDTRFAAAMPPIAKPAVTCETMPVPVPARPARTPILPPLRRGPDTRLIVLASALAGAIVFAVISVLLR